MKRQLIIETIGSCNLKCSMCPTLSYATGKHTMSEGVFEKLLDYIKNNHQEIDSIDFSGWGEPLLDVNIFEKIRNIRKISGEISLGFVSNGTLIDDRTIELINENLINYIIISFDGATEETYNKIRINADFSKVVDNLEKLSMNKHSTLSLSASCVIMKENIGEIEKTVALFNRLNFDTVFFKPLNVISTKDNIESIICKNDILQELDSFDKNKYSIKIAHWDLEDNKIERNCLANVSGGAVFINCNGDVSPCCNIGHHVPLYNKNNSIETLIDDNSYFFGNIKVENLAEILASQKYQTFIEEFQDNRLPRPCWGCQLVSENLKCDLTRQDKP